MRDIVGRRSFCQAAGLPVRPLEGICPGSIDVLPHGEPEEIRPGGVPPWNHLRQNLQPAQVFLNRLRKDDYLAAFGRHLVILDVESRRRGEAHLTHEIARELSSFSREDLLTGAMTVILRKPRGEAGRASAETATRAVTRRIPTPNSALTRP
jgi:hypothetical protein